MTDYDNMSVDQLLFEFAELERNHIGTHWEIQGVKGVVVEDPNPLNIVARKAAIVSALRKAVIREASVGTVSVTLDEIHCREDDVYIHVVVPDEPEKLPLGQYWIVPVPKETL